MSAHLQRKSVQLTGLQRVIKTRLASATQALQKELDSLRKIEQEIETRKGQLRVFEDDVVDIQQYLSGVTSNFNETDSMEASEYQLGLKRRFWIEYDREREQYYLDLTYDELKEQARKVQEARSVYKSWKYKSDTLDGKLREFSKLADTLRTNKAEAEYQDNLIHAAGTKI